MFCLKEECEKFRNNEPCDDNIQFCEKTLAEHDAKVREDAIDEVYEILKKEYYYGFRTPYGSKQRIVDMIINGFFKKLKQLKEQKE